MAPRITGTIKTNARQRVQVGELVVGGDPQGSGVGTAGGSVLATSFQSVNPTTRQDIVYSGASGRDNSWMFAQLGLSGTVTNDSVFGVAMAAGIRVSPDTVNADSASPFSYFGVEGRAGTGRRGTRHGVHGGIVVNGAPHAAETYGAVVGVGGIVSVNVNQNGTGGADPNDWLGSIFGGNFNVFTAGTATYLNLVNGCEFDVSVVTGTSTLTKYGISIVKGALDAVRADTDDAAISINDQDGASIGWEFGLKFGSSVHQWAFDADSTLIGAEDRVLPAPEAAVALYGVDFSAVDFQSGGAAFKSANFAVTPSGAILTIDGASGPVVRPSYVSGKFYAPAPGISAAAAIPAADIIYLLPFEISSPITLTGADVRVTTGGAGSSIKVAIWADSAVSHRPLGAPLIVDNTGVATATSSTDVTPALTGTLQPGRYWYGIKTTGTPPSCNSYTATQWMAWLVGVKSDATNPVGAHTISYGDTYSNNMPTFAEGATFNAVSVAVPVLLLKT